MAPYSIQQILPLAFAALFVAAIVFSLHKIFIRQDKLAQIFFAMRTTVWSVCQSSAGLGLVQQDPDNGAAAEIHASVGLLVRQVMWAAGAQLGDKVRFSVDSATSARSMIKTFHCRVVGRT
jgi:hypothetical protein